MKQGFMRIFLLAVFAVTIGTGVAWMQASADGAQNGAEDIAAIAPAAGDHNHDADGSTDGATSATVTPIGGDFTLTDHNGAVVTQDDFPGYKLVFFGFTHCPDVCPAGLKKMSQTLEILGEDAAAIQPLFITVDPERDTPEIMKEYVGLFDERMVGLTGTKEEIKTVMQDFRVYAAKAPMDHGDHGAHADHGATDGSGPYTMNHSGFTYLLGPDGYMVTVFASDEDPASMAQEIRAITERS